MHMLRFLSCALLAASLLFMSAARADVPALFERDNLMAWCIVPFDAKKRGPEARAEMLSRLGFKKFAYDWRDEHIPTFDEEIETLKRWGIELSAFWFPGGLNDQAKAILAALERHKVHTQLWVSMGGGDIVCTPEEQALRVQQHVDAIRPIAEAAAAIGCTVGLYNHGSWFGEPENQIAIIKALGAPNVGIVYNQHHGHGHIDRFPALLQQMMPYLYCLNLNGMEPKGDEIGKKIWPLGSGSLDLNTLRIIQASGYTGPIGMLGHTPDDAELTLHQNLDGLDWLLPQLDGAAPVGPRPALRVGAEQNARATDSLSPAFGKALSGGKVVEGNDAWRTPPITVEVRAQLNSANGFNILVANDTKASGAHWEIFTEAGSGGLSVYTPGLEPDHLRTGKNICDGAWHQVTLHYAADSIALFIDGAEAGRQAIKSLGKPTIPAGLALGQLVEGGFHCDGAIDDVRISSGIRPVSNSNAPLTQDTDTLALFDFEDLQASAPAPPEVEDPARRAALPEFQFIPAAATESLAPAADLPDGTFAWSRSHGGPHNARYSPDATITPENVRQLQVAWEYRSGDGEGNIQCNPIVVDGVIFTPTPGDHLVALDGATGKERWRFKPGGKPAYRGLTHWPGDAEHPPRLLFTAGEYLWAVDPETGQPLSGFGEGGKAVTGEVRSAPAVYRNVIVLPGYAQNVHGFDLHTGQRLWTFHTIPTAGEPNADTWSQLGSGANTWGGIALDEARGMVFLATGSPKPNFAGNTHTGQNLYANCVLALDALTGAYRWHFQEIRHDIWDLDIPAAPNLVTVTHEGRRVDAVAQVTKLGNTLLLDRVTGNPLHPVRLRRAPTSPLPGERTWPYQPDIELPEPFSRAAFTIDRTTNRTAAARKHVLASAWEANTGWFATFEEEKPTILYGIHGGAEWTGAAFDPGTGKLYVTANHIPWIVTVFRTDPPPVEPNAPPTPGELLYREHCIKCHGAERFGVGTAPPLHGLARRMSDKHLDELLRTGRGLMPALPKTVDAEQRAALVDYLLLRDRPYREAEPGPLRYTHNGYPKLQDHEGLPGGKPPWGTLNCIDLNTGKLAWKTPLGNYPAMLAQGKLGLGAENFGGASVNAGGVVFCSGTADLQFRAFDANTGAELWQHALPFGGYAPPTLYTANGKAHVLIPATGGGKLNTTPGDAFVAFTL
jgi:glucose dehydrogenase/sugar phosphate isomerase/epimerase